MGIGLGKKSLGKGKGVGYLSVMDGEKKISFIVCLLR